MSFSEKSLQCSDCAKTFPFTVAEQEVFASKGFTNHPKRCPSCRQERKTRQLATGTYRSVQPGYRLERKMFPVTCTQCGKSTQVPFEPKDGRPVYCRDCYNAKVSR